MIKYILIITALVLTHSAHAGEWTGNINAFYGYKHINDSYFENYETDDHSQLALMIDVGRTNWPFHIVVDRTSSHVNEIVTTGFLILGTRVDVETDEFNIGLRKIWQPSERFRLFIGGGMATSRVDYALDRTLLTDRQDSDRGTGYWFGSGLYSTLAGYFNIGLDVRHSSVDVELFDETVDAGGTSVSFMMGYHW